LHVLHAPPRLDEALVSGSAANGCLASIFTDEQQPLAIEPTSFSRENGDESGGGYGHRRQL
jgi:hypothetical protein